MDREIKFRGKDIVERHWRIGSYIYQYLKCPIIQVCKPARADAASYIAQDLNYNNEYCSPRANEAIGQAILKAFKIMELINDG